MIFVDTGAWAAFFVEKDTFHQAAVRWMQENWVPLISSDYVLDELLTLLKSKFGALAALEAGEALWGERFSALTFLTTDDLREAWRIFRSHSDKGWSFTDSASNALMKRLRISQAFSFDRHFSQMVGVHRVP